MQSALEASPVPATTETSFTSNIHQGAEDSAVMTRTALVPHADLSHTSIPEIARDEGHTSLVKKIGKFAIPVLSVIEEGSEVASNFYATYILVAYNPAYESKWGYAFVGTGAGVGSLVEILEITGAIGPKKYEHYRNIKEALAGAAAGANLLQGFMNPDKNAVIISYGVLLVLTAGKSCLNIYKDRDFFKTTIGKITKYGGDSIYNLLMGAGISAYLFSICSGFGANVRPVPLWSVTAGVATLNLVANLVKKYDPSGKNITKLYKAAHAVCCLLYGCEPALFSVLLQVDIYSDIENSDDIKNRVFYTILAIAWVHGGLVTLKKFLADEHVNHLEHEQLEHEQEHESLLSHVANDEEAPAPESTSRSCPKWLSFWKTEEGRQYDRLHTFNSTYGSTQSNGVVQHTDSWFSINTCSNFWHKLCSLTSPAPRGPFARIASLYDTDDETPSSAIN